MATADNIPATQDKIEETMARFEAGAKEAKALAFCKAASTQQGLQLPAAPDHLSRGCDDDSPVPSQAEIELDKSTIPVDTPLEYRNQPPRYWDGTGNQYMAKRQDLDSSEDVDSCPPSKSRDCDAVEEGDATCEAAAEAFAMTVGLFSHPPHQLFRLFKGKVTKTNQLTDELGELRKSYA